MNLKFQGGAPDSRDLEDDSFDLVVSGFGAMFAPKPFAVAKEMLRVTRPGGRVILGSLDSSICDRYLARTSELGG